MAEREIFQMDQPQGRIQRAIVNRQARHARAAENFDQLVFGGRLADRYDIGLGHHHIFHPHTTQVQQARPGGRILWQ